MVVEELPSRGTHSSKAQRASVVGPTTADVILLFDFFGANAILVRAHVSKWIRELFGTPWIRNSIWSPRIFLLPRMNASCLLGTYGT